MVQTASIYRLARATGFQVPIEPVIDLVPGVSPNRVTMDIIDNEDVSLNYTVTQNRLQDFSNATTNVHKELKRFVISGVMVSTFQFPQPNPIGASAGFPGLRLDLLRISNLETIADRKEPVMVVTPRFSLAMCFIESIRRPWTPDIGQNTPLTIACVEARIVLPGQSSVIPDQAGQLPGNGQAAGGGNQAGTASNSPAQPSAVTGVAPA
jgi:hypothetical protein